ncbi:hypothetical protein AB4186_23920 [Vibrio lentus]|uniref:hypothetical protein n=1 Tax=Vibrio cyclitrophicus TaxID=47951 RepID=UPI000C82EAE8|nr:hypothetical protein [Vibrio cyclitrophicus]PMK98785.1 hypothetical protein BCT87_03720 [Vibrio cyclitrophicus]
MISEITFSKKFTAFWNELLPNARNHIRLINGGLTEAMYEPFSSAERKENIALVNVMSFQLLRKVINKEINNEKVNSSTFHLSPDFDSVMFTSLDYLSRFSYGNACSLPLNNLEISQIIQLYKKMYIRCMSSKHTRIIDPEFNGCGYINDAKGDILIDNTLIEIKSGERNFSIYDIRQVLVYCALNSYSKNRKKIEKIELFNPRMGISFSEDIDNLCRDLSSLSSQELYSEIEGFITDISFVEPIY